MNINAHEAIIQLKKNRRFYSELEYTLEMFVREMELEEEISEQEYQNLLEVISGKARNKRMRNPKDRSAN